MKRFGCVVATVALVVVLVVTSVSAGGIGVVDMNALFEDHPERLVRYEELQAVGDQMTVQLREELAALETDEERQELRELYSARWEEEKLQVRLAIIESIRSFVEGVATAEGIEVVVPKAYVVYGGIDLTQKTLEAMYESLAISLPSHLRAD